MAKPRVFISFTFYDLKQVRADLGSFIRSLGYDVVRNEEGNIPYDANTNLEDACYKEINSIDILVAIIGGRFGTSSDNDKSYSISNTEIKTAIEHNKQVYIFIDRDVDSEYQTYLRNKDREIDYSFADDKRIFQFIEEIKSLKKNNVIHAFTSSNDIISFLKEQWAGLFQHFLQEQSKMAETDTLRDLKEALVAVKDLTSYLVSANENHSKNIDDILFYNHPVFTEIKRVMAWKFPIIFHNLAELKLLFEPWGLNWPSRTDKEGYFQFTNIKNSYNIFILSSLFDKDGNLKAKFSDTNNPMVIRENIIATADDLPF